MLTDPGATDWGAIADAISQATGERGALSDPRSVGGGSINSAWRVEFGGQALFIKLNAPDLHDMFAAEAEGLAAMAAVGAIRVPEPVCNGVAAGHSFIALEYVAFGGSGDLARAGAEFAQMHRSTEPRFGWHRDNTIGSTPQPNQWMDDWVAFWRERRLGFQLELAGRQGYGGELQRLGGRLLERLDDFFVGYAPPASLLHGDLWGGNFSFDRNRNPCIYDPATYYGDREADFAMTELFGGFGPRFRAGYDEVWALDDGYTRRRSLYQLYHILNHLNLFGSGYHGQAIGMLQTLV